MANLRCQAKKTSFFIPKMSLKCCGFDDSGLHFGVQDLAGIVDLMNGLKPE
jgi:hypothetical protein